MYDMPSTIDPNRGKDTRRWYTKAFHAVGDFIAPIVYHVGGLLYVASGFFGALCLTSYLDTDGDPVAWVAYAFELLR